MSLIEKQMKKRIGTFLKAQGGIGLLETLLAVAILGVVGAGFLQALGTASRGAETHQERVTATSVAQSQVEYIKTQDYTPLPGSYELITSSPPGYTVSLDTTEDNGKQEVTVEVHYRGDFVFQMTTVKVDW